MSIDKHPESKQPNMVKIHPLNSSNNSPDGPANANTLTQALRATIQLREMILAGEVQGGARIAEMSLVELLGVSRTPIRQALMKLEQEGLLDELPQGGYAVRTFSELEASESIELRGMLEGMMVRLASERGYAPSLMREAKRLLGQIDEILKSNILADEAFSKYIDFNARFHDVLVDMADSPFLKKELDRIYKLPFASPSGFVGVQFDSEFSRDLLVVAQDQHSQVLQAIESKEGTRAEMIMREHSRIAQRNLRLVANNASHEQMPVAKLLKKRS